MRTGLSDFLKGLIWYTLFATVVVMVQRGCESNHTSRDRVRQIRSDNELVAFSELASGSPLSGQTSAVRVADLLRTYRDSAELGDQVYTGEQVRVPLRSNYVARGRSIHWHLGDLKIPAVLVFEFDAPVDLTGVKGLVWIVGTCDGMIRDEVKRDLNGYEFFVKVSNCRLIVPAK